MEGSLPSKECNVKLQNGIEAATHKLTGRTEYLIYKLKSQNTQSYGKSCLLWEDKGVSYLLKPLFLSLW